MNRIHNFLALAVMATATFAACDGGDDGGPPGSASPVGPTHDITDATARDGPRITLSGNLTLDGAPLEAPFLGARVIRNGLAAACQDEIPSVAGGRYEITVAPDGEVRGCGAPGAQVLLWTYVHERYLFSTRTIGWPEDASALTFDAAFTTADADGASSPVTELKGKLFDASGAELPAGTVVEAYAVDTLCGVTSLRPAEQTEGYYTLIVAGPEAIPACAADATLTFRLDGQPAAQTATNDLASGATGRELDLTLAP